MKKLSVVVAILAASALPAAADIVRLKNGGKIEGVVVREKEDGLVIRLKYATVTLDRSEIASIEKSAPPPGSGGKAPRLPRWDRCVEVLAPREWDGRPQQVPAMVIESGPFKNVPYMSFRSGNYEFNLYGDPEAPAAIELGIHPELAKNADAKKKCAEAAAELLGDPKDVELLRSLGFQPAQKNREGMVFAVAQDEGDDSGWWLTVYDTDLLEKSRASQEELDRIAATREEMEKQAAEVKAEDKRLREEAAKKRALDKKAAEEAKQTAVAEGQTSEPPPPKPEDFVGTEDEWVSAWWLWGRYDPRYTRLRPRINPLATTKPRYYTPGYNRTGGAYRAGPRIGGRGRR